MVYCPRCGSLLEFMDITLYRCTKCGTWWIVHTDSERGDIYTVTMIDTDLLYSTIEKLMKHVDKT